MPTTDRTYQTLSAAQCAPTQSIPSPQKRRTLGPGEDPWPKTKGAIPRAKLAWAKALSAVSFRRGLAQVKGRNENNENNEINFVAFVAERRTRWANRRALTALRPADERALWDHSAPSVPLEPISVFDRRRRKNSMISIVGQSNFIRAQCGRGMAISGDRAATVRGPRTFSHRK